MKRCLLLILLTCLLSSCGNDYIKDGKSLINKEKETNLYVLSKLDTTQTYQIYIDSENDKLYAYNMQTKKIDYAIADESGEAITLLIAFCILMFMFIFIFMGILLAD